MSPSTNTTKPPKPPKGSNVVSLRGHKKAQKRTKHPGVSEKEIAAIKERWGLEGLDDIDKKILTFTLEKPGMTDSEIAAVVGLRREQVNRRKNAPKFKAAVEEAQLTTLALIAQMQPLAARTIQRLMRPNYDPEIQLQAAKFTLSPVMRSRSAGEGDADDDFLSAIEEAEALRKKLKLKVDGKKKTG